MFFPWPPPPCIFFHVSVFFPFGRAAGGSWG
jgi:hypothetical protein